MAKNPEIKKSELGHLVGLAKQVIKNSYSPYSDFPVAAVVVTETGGCYTGVNVENSSYGLTSCAERNAIFSAVTAGARNIEKVLIYTPTEQPVTPCGACRQVIREFSDSATIESVCDSDATFCMDIEQLLPSAFELNDFAGSDSGVSDSGDEQN